VGVILGAAYMLWLVQRLFYGPESKLALSKPPNDLHFRELAVLWPLAVLMLVMGLAPMLWLPAIETAFPRVQLVVRVIPGPVHLPEPVLPTTASPISNQGEGLR
jgi:NADH:ubiquinone oxidoreductase subunit 4 (subunit M)